MKTQALAAFVESRKATFAGSPVTLRRLSQMWNLTIDPNAVSGDALEQIARYFKLSVEDLVAGVAKMLTPAPAAKPVVPVVAKPPERPTPAPLPPPPPAPASPPPAPPPVPAPVTAPEPTAVIPKEQLTDLVAASCDSSPTLDPEISISFDEVEATPPPEAPESSSAASAPPSSSTKSTKSTKGKADKKKR